MKVVVCALAKNEHLYINEWVNHYLLLGVDKIYICDNDDLDKPYIGDYIEHKEKVEIINIRGKRGKNMHHMVFSNFYNKYDFDWCIFCDIDEFLMGIDDIHEFLKYKHVPQIRIKWKLFGDDNLITRDMSKGLIETFKKEIKHSLKNDLVSPNNLENQGKSIVKGHLKNVVFRSPHFASYITRSNVLPSILPSGLPCKSKVEIEEDYSNETVFFNHYMTKSLDEFINQKLNRNDAVFDTHLKMNYYWRINKKTKKKLDYLKAKGIINGNE